MRWRAGRTSHVDTGTRRTGGGDGAAALAEDGPGSTPRTASSRLCDVGQVIPSAGADYSACKMGTVIPTPRLWEGANETMFPIRSLTRKCRRASIPRVPGGAGAPGADPRRELLGRRLLVAGTDRPPSDPRPAKP